MISPLGVHSLPSLRHIHWEGGLEAYIVRKGMIIFTVLIF